MLDTTYWKTIAEEKQREISELRAEVHELKEDSDQDALELWLYRALAVIGWGLYLAVIFLGNHTTGV